MMRTAKPNEHIVSIISLAQEIGWLENLDDANRNILYRELGELHVSGLQLLRRELEQRLRGRKKQ